jgi:hypothetical protein
MHGQYNVKFLGRVSKNPQTQNFMKIRRVGSKLFHADTDRHDKANSSFSQILRTRLKMQLLSRFTFLLQNVCLTKRLCEMHIYLAGCDN